MNIFNIISLLGGLALFLYGMRLMSGTLKENSSGTLKKVMEKVTNNPLKAFVLGVLITAIIQSSTATIVITSGLVAAGLITLRQSLGIIIGANVGTTVTGQIIRLLDVNAESGSFLEFLKPSTLAPLALIFGIALIMFFNFHKSDSIGNILVGFGILFTGLLNMTAAVSTLTEGGLLESVFSGMGNNPILGYLAGLGVAFVLQSSSATIGILQAFAQSSDIPFATVYIVICGVYLGDCVTTAIVCSIGSKSDSKRVGIVNILYNLCKTLLIIAVVTIIHRIGLLDNMWNTPLNSGGIANVNSVFNLVCAVVLLPLVSVFEKLSYKIVSETPEPAYKYAHLLDGLNPVFFKTPALAFRSCYNVLNAMIDGSRENIFKAMDLLYDYDDYTFADVETEENNIDILNDRVSEYLCELSPYIKEEEHIRILDQYYKDVTEFERLSDHAMNIAEVAKSLNSQGITFSDIAEEELKLVGDLLDRILEYTKITFDKRDGEAARHIEPLEEVMDDLINMLHDDHLERLREGKCTINGGTCFLDVLSNLERISDTCSNVGVATIARINPATAYLAHNYISSLHQGNDTAFNEEYHTMHDKFFLRVKDIQCRFK